MPWGVAAGFVGSMITADATNSAASSQAAATKAAAAGTNLAPFTYNGPGGQSAGLSNLNQTAPSANFNGFGALAGLGNPGYAGSSPPASGVHPAMVPTQGKQAALAAAAGHPAAAAAKAPVAAQGGFGIPVGTNAGGVAVGSNPFGIPTAKAAPGTMPGAAPANGLGGAIGGAGGFANVNLGPTMNANTTGLNTLAANMTGQAGLAANGPLPQNIQTSLSQLAGATPVAPGTQDLLQQQYGGLTAAQGSQLGLMGAGMNQLNNPVINQANNAAQNQIYQANTGYQTNYNNNLQQNLAALQIPQQQQTAQLQDQEFQRGQLGTSGGALQTQAQAAGFGQSDLQAAISAQSQALATQQTAGSLANSFSGIATGQQATGNNLLSNAYGQFNNSANVAGNTANNIYNQNQSINQTDYQRALTNFGTQQTAAGLPTALASNDLALGAAALNQSSGINQIGLTDYNAALATSQAQSNAQNKAASNMGAIATSPNFMGPNTGTGQFLSQAASNYQQNGNPFQNIANNSGNNATAADYTGSNYAGGNTSIATNTPTQDPSITGYMGGG